MGLLQCVLRLFLITAAVVLVKSPLYSVYGLSNFVFNPRAYGVAAKSLYELARFEMAFDLPTLPRCQSDATSRYPDIISDNNCISLCSQIHNILAMSRGENYKTVRKIIKLNFKACKIPGLNSHQPLTPAGEREIELLRLLNQTQYAYLSAQDIYSRKLLHILTVYSWDSSVDPRCAHVQSIQNNDRNCQLACTYLLNVGAINVLASPFQKCNFNLKQSGTNISSQNNETLNVSVHYTSKATETSGKEILSISKLDFIKVSSKSELMWLLYKLNVKNFFFSNFFKKCSFSLPFKTIDNRFLTCENLLKESFQCFSWCMGLVTFHAFENVDVFFGIIGSCGLDVEKIDQQRLRSVYDPQRGPVEPNSRTAWETWFLFDLYLDDQLETLRRKLVNKEDISPFLSFESDLWKSCRNV